MTTFPFTCRDGHTPIGFSVLAPDDDERCPLCLLRDEMMVAYDAGDAGLLWSTVHSYPYTEEPHQ